MPMKNEYIAQLISKYMYTSIIILNFTPTTFGVHNGSRQQGKYIRLYRSLRWILLNRLVVICILSSNRKKIGQQSGTSSCDRPFFNCVFVRKYPMTPRNYTRKIILYHCVVLTIKYFELYMYLSNIT